MIECPMGGVMNMSSILAYTLLALAGVLATLAAVGAFVKTRVTDRQLRAARIRKALPEARVV